MKLNGRTSELLISPTRLEAIYKKNDVFELKQQSTNFYSSILAYCTRAYTEKIWFNVFNTRKNYESYRLSEVNNAQKCSQPEKKPQALVLVNSFQPIDWLMIDFYMLKTQKNLFYNKKYYDKAQLSKLQKILTNSYSACVFYSIFSLAVAGVFQQNFVNFIGKNQTLKKSKTLILTITETFQRKHLFKKFLLDLSSRCLVWSDLVKTASPASAPWLKSLIKEEISTHDCLAFFKQALCQTPKFICKSLMDFSSITVDSTKLANNQSEFYALLTGHSKESFNFDGSPAQSFLSGSNQQLKRLKSYLVSYDLEKRLVYAFGQKHSQDPTTGICQIAKEQAFLISGDYLFYFANDVANISHFLRLWSVNLSKFGVKCVETRFSHSLFPLVGKKIGFEFNSFYVFQKKCDDRRTNKDQTLIETNVVPSPFSTMLYLKQLKQVIKQSQGQSQESLIRKLTPAIQNWSSYYKVVSNKRSFYSCDKLLFQWIWRWACRRHPSKSRRWIQQKYYRSSAEKHWMFCARNTAIVENVCLPEHSQIRLSYPLKTRSQSSFHDENWKSWLSWLS